jgi:hypothetical protein
MERTQAERGTNLQVIIIDNDNKKFISNKLFSHLRFNMDVGIGCNIWDETSTSLPAFFEPFKNYQSKFSKIVNLLNGTKDFDFVEQPFCETIDAEEYCDWLLIRNCSSRPLKLVSLRNNPMFIKANSATAFFCGLKVKEEILRC